MNIVILGIRFRSAKDLKTALTKETERQERGEKSDTKRDTFYYLCGCYESRILGICFMRDHSGEFIDKITDRYRKAIKAKSDKESKA